MEEVILNQIEAMTTTDLEALYGRLETEAFRLRVSISAVSLELEARIKSRRETPLGVEETGADGTVRLAVWPSIPTPYPNPAAPRADEVEDIPVVSVVHCGEPCETCDEEAAVRAGFAAFREEAVRRYGRPRGPMTGSRRPDHSSCCGAEGRRMNSETEDCAACREVVE